ncbi:LCP family protein [Streptomyces sp. JJ36]|uniref:LCP family protein n=1 Tax=Streptomyces sp. JJ36 TaxID=2736645 RepID=UPI001F43072D|nr:LCP family protein [Streptomyces sp. JJ36]MCF6524017.1 LCP family protein [Streptomyces sp. JJ36]
MDADVTASGTPAADGGDVGDTAEPAGSGDAEHTADADGPPRPRGRRRWLRWAGLGASVLVLAAAGTGWTLYQRLDGNIRTDTAAAEELARHEEERPAAATGEAGEARNILLLGSDSRAGANGKYGRTEGARADTTILLHLSADRTGATAVSLPRDLMVDIPSCRTPDGGRSTAQFAQFNWAFQAGGAACTIRTVERLTGIRIDHHLVVDFTGFTDLVDAVGGVEVCLPHDVYDEDAQLDLTAGRHVLAGEQALGYVRSRHAFDGSDTQRMERQQEFLGSLVRKVRDEGTLTNPTELYPVLDAVTSSVTADPGLDSLRELYDLTRDLRDIPDGGVRFLTVPRRPYSMDPNRDELVQPAARRLFEQLRADLPVRVGGTTQPAGHAPGTSPSAGPSPDAADTSPESATPSTPPRDGSSPGHTPVTEPTYRGTTAAQDTCSTEGEPIGRN